MAFSETNNFKNKMISCSIAMPVAHVTFKNCKKCSKYYKMDVLVFIQIIHWNVQYTILGNNSFHSCFSYTLIWKIVACSYWCVIIIILVYFRVTKEHRENLAKNAKALFVKCRDSVREVQNKYVKTVKNNTNISQDLAHNLQEQVGYHLITSAYSNQDYKE